MIKILITAEKISNATLEVERELKILKADIPIDPREEDALEYQEQYLNNLIEAFKIRLDILLFENETAESFKEAEEDFEKNEFYFDILHVNKMIEVYSHNRKIRKENEVIIKEESRRLRRKELIGMYNDCPPC